MYADCVQDGRCDEPSDTTNFSDSNYGSHPVAYITWYAAVRYCSWADRELPTEAEWEKAASWDDENQIKNIYSWGDNIDCSFANYQNGNKPCVGSTTAVGSYPKGASPYGALDMTGNIWEWVSSLYEAYPYDATGGRENLTSSDTRVQRGAPWSYESYYVRSTMRNGYGSSNSSGNDGFRCSLSP